MPKVTHTIILWVDDDMVPQVIVVPGQRTSEARVCAALARHFNSDPAWARIADATQQRIAPHTINSVRNLYNVNWKFFDATRGCIVTPEAK